MLNTKNFSRIVLVISMSLFFVGASSLIALRPVEPSWMAQEPFDPSWLKRGVVKIIAHKYEFDTDTEVGVGIVVGLEGNIVLILTAHHAVHDAKKIDVMFYEEPQEFMGTVERYDEGLDIAVLRVDLRERTQTENQAPLSHDFPNFIPGDDSMLREEMRVWTIGKTDWKFSTIKIFDNPEDDRKFRFTDHPLQEEEDSSGLIFNEQGALIGIVTRFDHIHGIAVKMEPVLEALRGWEIPTAKLSRPIAIRLYPQLNLDRRYAQMELTRPITVRAYTYPPTTPEGEPTQIIVTASSSQREPIPDAEVRISAGGGVFQASGKTVVYGRTDERGEFKTEWRCRPCAKGYVFGIEVNKRGYTKGVGRAEVSIL